MQRRPVCAAEFGMNRFVSREPVDAGWSGDRKYRVTDETGRAFLLRVAPEAALARKQTEFSYVRRAASLGVPMCRPVDVGLCGEGRTSFTNGLTARTRRLCCRACLPLNSTHTVKAPAARCGCCMPSPRPKRRKAKVWTCLIISDSLSPVKKEFRRFLPQAHQQCEGA